LFFEFFPHIKGRLILKQQSFLNNSNFLILVAPAAAVAIMTFLLSRGNAGAAIGTGITSIVSVKAIDRRDTEVEVLKDRFRRLKNAEELIAKLPSLQAETQTLTTRQNKLKNNIDSNEKELSNFREQLHHTKGELSQKEGTLKVVRQDIADLSKTKDELERRIAITNQQNPDLAVRERLYSETEQLRLQRTSLEEANSNRSTASSVEGYVSYSQYKGWMRSPNFS
jgi:septal ring factor EnvC (AmiA/AmiB activator)